MSCVDPEARQHRGHQLGVVARPRSTAAGGRRTPRVGEAVDAARLSPCCGPSSDRAASAPRPARPRRRCGDRIPARPGPGPARPPGQAARVLAAGSGRPGPGRSGSSAHGRLPSARARMNGMVSIASRIGAIRSHTCVENGIGRRPQVVQVVHRAGAAAHLELSEASSAPVSHALASPPRPPSPARCGRSAASAEDSVQPVPWVLRGVDPGPGQQRRGAVRARPARRWPASPPGRWPPLTSTRAPVAGGQPAGPGRSRRPGPAATGSPEQHRQLGQVRGDHVGQRQQPRDRLLGVRVQQPVAAGGHHHRVEHHVRRPVPVSHARDRRPRCRRCRACRS